MSPTTYTSTDTRWKAQFRVVHVGFSSPSSAWRLGPSGSVQLVGNAPEQTDATEPSQANQANLQTEWQPLGSDGWLRVIRERMFAIDGIESVYFAKDENTINVWAIIAKRDIRLVRKIAATQREITREFVNSQREAVLSFDFHTMYRESHQENELVPLRAVPLPRP